MCCLCFQIHPLPVLYSSDPHSLAVEIEHEVFMSCKSANLYKASVLKRVSVFESNPSYHLIIQSCLLYIRYGLCRKQRLTKELTCTHPKCEQSIVWICGAAPELHEVFCWCSLSTSRIDGAVRCKVNSDPGSVRDAVWWYGDTNDTSVRIPLPSVLWKPRVL